MKQVPPTKITVLIVIVNYIECHENKRDTAVLCCAGLDIHDTKNEHKTGQL